MKQTRYAPWKWKKIKHNDRTADQSKRVKASLPQSFSCHVVGQPFDTVVQAALVQSNRVSLWRRTKESVSVSDSSDWNCVELFAFSAFCFHPAHWWNRSNVLLSATAQQNCQPWPVKQGILVASNERECQCTWLVRFELCWTFLVLQFLLSSRALMKRLQRTTRRFPDSILNVSISSLVTSRHITVSNCTAELAAMAAVKKRMCCHKASKTGPWIGDLQKKCTPYR